MPNHGYFAQLDSTNTVVQVITGVPVDDYSDADGQAHINNVLGLTGTWLHHEPFARAGSLYTLTPIYSAGVAGNDYGFIAPLMDNVEHNRSTRSRETRNFCEHMAVVDEIPLQKVTKDC